MFIVWPSVRHSSHAVKKNKTTTYFTDMVLIIGVLLDKPDCLFGGEVDLFFRLLRHLMG